MRPRTRREILKLTAAAAVAFPALGQEKRRSAPETRFFTPEEFRLVDELTEQIIPADDHSPGARAAQVAAYIDARLDEVLESETRQLWRDGLQRVNALAIERYGGSFLEIAVPHRLEIMTAIARNERAAKSLEERFFRELKSRTIKGYYTSRIGIHEELEYKGNTYLEDFVGYEAG